MFVPFFEDNKELYFIVFYLIVILLLIVTIVLCYVGINSTHTKLNSLWTLSLLRIALPLIDNLFYLPILYMLISTYSCNKGYNILLHDEQCWNGFFYLHGIIGVLFSIVFIVISFITQTFYFDTKYSSQNPLAKTTSQIDVSFLFVKTIIAFLFNFFGYDTSNESKQWFIIIIMLFMSGFHYYLSNDYEVYYDKLITKCYKCLYGLFAWSCVVLVFSKILQKTPFNGGLGLFFIGVPILLLLELSEVPNTIDHLIYNITKGKKGEKFLHAIQIFKELIDLHETDRKAKIILSGYIEQVEENCPLKDCPLKKYVKCLNENKIDTVVFLLQHVEHMYQNAITKFPLCIMIRISYAFFLIERMNKKKKALTELSNSEKYNLSAEQQFIIYRYKKLLDEQSTEINENGDNLDLVTNLEYKIHFTHFKNSIIKTSILYLDFWSLLLNPNQDNQEDLAKLNDYGTKINVLVEDIKNRFEKMQKLKHNDIEGLKYYSDFLNDILNDKERAKALRKRLEEIEIIKLNSEEANILNIDINTLSSNNEYQYLIVSAQPKKFGIITNVSLGICVMLGFTRNELIGKALDILIPEIFHREHNEILLEELNEFKKKSIDIIDIAKFKPQFTEIVTYGKNKSRYLVPITIRATLIPTERNDNVFIAQIIQNYAPINNNVNPSCCVITNNLLIIQNFTPNAMNMLNMSSMVMNSSVDITDYIKQFNEDFLKLIVENEDKTPEQKLLLKQTILMKKFKNPLQINWKLNEFSELKHRLKKNNFDAQIHNSFDYDDCCNNSPVNRGNTKIQNANTNTQNTDEWFNLVVEEAIIRKRKVGYVFKFEKIGKENTCASAFAVGKKVSAEKIQVIKKGNIQTSNSFNPNTSTNNINRDNSTSNKNILSDDTSPKRNISGKIININDTLNNFYNNSDAQMHHGASVVEKHFVPDNGFKFHLDPISLSYKTKLDNNTNNMQRILKEEAMKRINFCGTNKDKSKYNDNSQDEEEEEDEESEDDDSDYDDEDDDVYYDEEGTPTKGGITNNHNSSNVQSSEFSDKNNANSSYNNNTTTNTNNNVNSKKKGTKGDSKTTNNAYSSTNNHINLGNNDSYYKVDLSKIKYILYNFTRNAFLEVTNWEKIDQVTLKTSNEHKKDSNSLSTKEDKSSKHIHTKNLHNITNKPPETDMEAQQRAIANQIEYALEKEETQPSITKMKWISLFMFTLLLCGGILSLVAILTSLNTLKENIIIIENSLQILLYNSYGLFYVRELTLLNNKYYTNIQHDNRTQYINYCLNQTLLYFKQIHELMAYIFTSTLKLSTEGDKFMNNKTILATVNNDDNSLDQYSVSLASAFIESNTALFQIGNTVIEEITATNKDVFYFLQNGSNEVAISLNEQVNVFINELHLNIQSSKHLSLIFLSANVIVFVIVYCCLSYAYDGVAKRKESYLEVFFEIGNSVIRNSLEKCENFTKKIQTESTSDFLSSRDGDDVSEEQMIIIHDKATNNNNVDHHRKINMNNISKETKVFRVKIVIELIVVSLIHTMLFVFFFIFLNNTKIRVNFFQKYFHLENDYLNLFNSLRTFMFDPNVDTMKQSTPTYLNEMFANIYIATQEKQLFITNHLQYISKQFLNIYNEIYLESSCNNRGDYFNNATHCEMFMENSTEFGLAILMSYFVEGMRLLKNKAVKNQFTRNNLTEYKHIYNLTISHTPKGEIAFAETLQSPDKETFIANMPIQNFNDNTHFELCVLFINIFHPTYSKLMNAMLDDVRNNFNNTTLLLLCIPSVFIGIVFLYYILVFLPFQIQLNQTIYKTKNMLSIIPKEVLASLNNIQHLLNINKHQKNVNGR